jgi:hypothetical protein
MVSSVLRLPDLVSVSIIFSSVSSKGSRDLGRSSSRTRNSETNECPNTYHQEHDCVNTAQVLRISQLDWPTSISSIDQPLTTIAYLKVGNGACRVPLTSINGNQ